MTFRCLKGIFLTCLRQGFPFLSVWFLAYDCSHVYGNLPGSERKRGYFTHEFLSFLAGGYRSFHNSLYFDPLVKAQPYPCQEMPVLCFPSSAFRFLQSLLVIFYLIETKERKMQFVLTLYSDFFFPFCFPVITAFQL